MLIYNVERYVETYSRRQKKRVDERLRKKAIAERKKTVRSAIKRKLDAMNEHEYCNNYYSSTTSSKYFF